MAAAGLNAASAQNATPEADDTAAPGSNENVAYLFLQSFQAGSIAPKAGEEGVFTLTLEQGLGQTVYSSDRPLRDVGATPTPQFLEALGFPADNPPNAALVAENGDSVNIAVVQLLNPTYDLPTHTASYDVVGMAHFQREAGIEVGEATADISAVPSTFEAAHLFIDDCPDTVISCFADGGHGASVPTAACTGFATTTCTASLRALLPRQPLRRRRLGLVGQCAQHHLQPMRQQLPGVDRDTGVTRLSSPGAKSRYPAPTKSVPGRTDIRVDLRQNDCTHRST